jgi:hypothetical protein
MIKDNDDEIWADENEPVGSNEQYDAVLEDIKDRPDYGRETIEASSRDPQRGHISRLYNRASGKFVPRVHTSVCRSSPFL